MAIACWLNTMGLPEMRSDSFPHAINDPEKVTAPIINAITLMVARPEVKSEPTIAAIATAALANPPTPLNNETSSGIPVISTFFDT